MEITDDKIEDIILALDEYGRDYDQYEFGLPAYDSKMDDMIAIVRAILRGE